jgi:hypothetical protein
VGSKKKVALHLNKEMTKRKAYAGHNNILQKTTKGNL